MASSQARLLAGDPTHTNAHSTVILPPTRLARNILSKLIESRFDYGFLLFSGELLSIPYKIEVSEPPHDDIDVYCFKELKLAPRGHAEAGMEIRGRVAGYYVLSTTGSRPVICFADVGILKKLMFRWRLIGKLKYA